VGIDDHQLDEDGFHDEDECEVCIEGNHSVACDCRCGRCCEGLLIEVSLRDAEREPRIVAECGPIYCDIATGTKEIIGYLLNDRANGYACRFFDRETRLCTIHSTRPLACRVFDCGEYEHAEDDPADPDSRSPDKATVLE